MRSLGETRRHFLIITTPAGKESAGVFMEEKMSHRYDEMIIPNNFKGNDRRLKYIGKKNRERFLILTSFSRRVSNVLSIPSDPLIPCGSFDPQAPVSFLSTHQA